MDELEARIAGTGGQYAIYQRATLIAMCPTREGAECIIAALSRAQAPSGEADRLREALNRAGAGLVASYALLNRLGDHDGASACMEMIEEIDNALAARPSGA